MEVFIVLLIGVIVVAAIASVQKKPQKPTGRSFPRSARKPEFDAYHQAILDSAKRHVDIINESLNIANESMNADTKISRLDVAKDKLEELKKISEEHPFIKLTTLSQVEHSISALEHESAQAGYREAAGGNMRGQCLEKEGNIDSAIEEYERLLEEGVDTPFTYRRLAIIYSKRKNKADELRVLRAAIKNVPIENSKHYQWFAGRLAKKTSTGKT